MNNEVLTLEEVISFIQNGELRNLAVADDYKSLCNFINLQLIELHQRFLLNQRIIEVELSKDKTTYDLLAYL